VELRGRDVSDGADAAHELARAGGSDERRERLPTLGDAEDADQASCSTVSCHSMGSLASSSGMRREPSADLVRDGRRDGERPVIAAGCRWSLFPLFFLL
jgi:predicted CxxxxCH...CXXCH cytochrome family protein